MGDGEPSQRFDAEDVETASVAMSALWIRALFAAAGLVEGGSFDGSSASTWVARAVQLTGLSPWQPKLLPIAVQESESV